MTYDEQLIKLKGDGCSTKEIASIVGRPERTVSRHLKRLGLTKSTDRTDILDQDILNDYNSGMTIIEIANKYHASHETITKRLNKYGISCDRTTGIRRHFDRVREELWPSLRADLDRGLSVTAVSRKHHIRYESLCELIQKKDYHYVYGKTMDLEYWNYRMGLLDGVHSKPANVEREYLLGIRSYYDTYGVLPKVQGLAEVLGKGKPHVHSMVKEHSLYMFVDDTNVSGSVAKILNDLLQMNIMYELNNRRILMSDSNRGLELDIWIPGMNLGIEVNPTTTHSVDSDRGVSDVGYHQNKALLAEQAGIGLLHMYDEDIFDERRYDVFLRQLRARVSDKTKIGARECVCKNVSRQVASDFLNRYHFQGSELSAKYRYGLFYNDVLVAVLCVGDSRYTNHFFEIFRYCVNPGYIISGCFDKLFCTFLRTVDCCSIVSYMDLNKRFSSHNVYERHGFVLDGVTKPDYVWTRDCGFPTLKRYDTMKQSLVKQGYDASMTEVEIMRSRSFYRVYGAGSKRYVYEYDGR